MIDKTLDRDVARDLIEQLWDVESDAHAAPVLDGIRPLLLDHLGATVRGSRSSSAAAVRATLAGQSTSDPEAGSGVIGVAERFGALDAMLCNAAAAHSIEFDDVHIPSSTHPGAIIFPAVLAIAEQERRSAADVVLGVVSGYEAIARIAEVATPGDLFARGFHPTGPLGTVGSAVAVSRVLGLTVDQAVSAVGLAADQASGSMHFLNHGGWTKHLHPGMAARTGALAALLARNGYRGPSRSIEGHDGFVENFANAQGVVRPRPVDPSRLAVLDTSLKPYPNCRYIHPVLDGVVELRRRFGADLDRVDEIVVLLPPVAYDIVGREGGVPRLVEEAQFDACFAVAVMLTTGSFTLETYRSDLPIMPAVRSLMDRIACRPDEELGRRYPAHWGATVRMRLGDRWVEAAVSDASGDPSNPMSWDGVVAKFTDLAQELYPSEWAAHVSDAVTAFPAPGAWERIRSLLQATPSPKNEKREKRHV